MNKLVHRVATQDDLPALETVIDRAIATLQTAFLTPEQVAASRHVMGLDTQLVRDGTYLVVEQDGVLAACGGWSFRGTLYGGDASVVAREAEILDPASQPTRIRAMYTDPAFARRGLGRMVLGLCERAAFANGFRQAELMATLAGEPLYRTCGYAPIERVDTEPVAGILLPLIRMTKRL